MKQILVMMMVVVLVGQSVVADEVVITDPVLEEVLGKKLKKPYGKFAPPMKLTKSDLETSPSSLTLASSSEPVSIECISLDNNFIADWLALCQSAGLKFP